jgi:hypothetical protein
MGFVAHDQVLPGKPNFSNHGNEENEQVKYPVKYPVTRIRYSTVFFTILLQFFILLISTIANDLFKQ